MNKEIVVNITPNKTLIKKMGQVGYSTAEALAEIVDNSIDARIDGKEEEIVVNLDFVKKQITVRDNGCGMNKDDLKNAMTIASGTKPDGSLGQFGIGLKSSCAALGKVFEIRTSKIDSKKEYITTYDEDEWIADDSLNWTNFKIVEKTLDEANRWHGTEITIKQIKVALYPNQVTKLKKNFSLRYDPYLDENQITIQINTTFCRPIHKDVEKDSRLNIAIEVSSRFKIKGHIELLKTRSIGGEYGIDLYRHGRLITPHVKFGFEAHPENARIVGKLNLDHVPVNFQKNNFVTESREYKESLNKFKKSDILKNILRMTRSHSSESASAESVFGFFTTGSPSQHIKHSMRVKHAQEILNTEPFEIKTRNGIIRVSIESNRTGSLYSIGGTRSKRTVTINRDSVSFKFVKNPLFLIGMIAAEVRTMHSDQNLENFVQARNESVEKSMQEIIKKNEKNSTSRNREIPIPDIPGYRLEWELVDLHEYLKENFARKFQFTAMSTLVPYLHNLRGKIVYTLHTAPNSGEDIVELLTQKFGDRFVILDQPNSKTLHVFLSMPNIDKIIAIREFETIRGSTIAGPEKAIMDLVVESNTYDIPIESAEVRRIFQNMARHDLIDSDVIHKYAKFIKKLPALEVLAK